MPWQHCSHLSSLEPVFTLRLFGTDGGAQSKWHGTKIKNALSWVCWEVTLALVVYSFQVQVCVRLNAFTKTNTKHSPVRVVKNVWCFGAAVYMCAVWILSMPLRLFGTDGDAQSKWCTKLCCFFYSETLRWNLDIESRRIDTKSFQVQVLLCPNAASGWRRPPRNTRSDLTMGSRKGGTRKLFWSPPVPQRIENRALELKIHRGAAPRSTRVTSLTDVIVLPKSSLNTFSIQDTVHLSPRKMHGTGRVSFHICYQLTRLWNSII